jgi:hypothetical protein
MFDYWLHEMGYTYVGPTSIYKLTLPEMSRLQRGYREFKQREEAAEHGIPSDRADEFDVRATPTTQSSSQLRAGDLAVADQFREN